MTRQTDLELALDRYLADRGDRLPDRVLEDALTEVDHTAQRRPSFPWRFPSMSTPLRLGLVAVAVIVAAVGGMYLLGNRSNTNVAATPSPTPTAQPSTAPSSQAPEASGPAMAQHESPIYGYTIGAPAAYQFIPATVEWPAGEDLGPETEWTDRFRAGTGTAFVGIASQPLPEGTTGDQWLDTYAATVETRECGGPVGDWTDVTFRDVPGRKLSFDCGGFAGVDYAWTLGDRGWVISGDAAVVEMMLPTLNIP
ncbi:MAG TPA: hypothetical protein VFV72_09695 [Candidatus Limnocylindrales bacterium]|nr:hypothetical protein [Candidatus Limnocylindrales bacterium]